MARLTAHQVAGYWVGAGGPRNRVVEWVAICLGESGYDDAAVSSAGAIGLWQIMPFNAGPYGHPPTDLYDPAVNARIAVAMSGHGTNCAAWDSCYRDIYASGRYSFLGWPEVGSADYDNLATVAAQLGGQSVDPLGGGAVGMSANSIEPAIQRIETIKHVMLPRSVKDLLAQRMVMDRMFRGGWRP